MGKSASKQAPQNLEDLTHTTLFTKQELQNWYEEFAKDCPSGKLAKAEFRSLYSKLFPFGDATKFAEHIFRVFDDNQDGSIDFREFICVMSIAQRGTPADKLKWAFRLYDLDNDGHVSQTEMTEIIRAVYKLSGNITTNHTSPEEKAAEIFKKMDLNKDGAVTEDEFVKVGQEDPNIGRLLRLATLSQ